MNASLQGPAIPSRLQRPLAALWISIGLHGALIALVQLAPPPTLSMGEPVIEASLVSTDVVPTERGPLPSEETPVVKEPAPAPSETADALPLRLPEPEPASRAEPQAQPDTPPTAALQPATEAATEAATTPATAPALPALAPDIPAPVAAITSAVDLTYYTARDVDVHPRVLREIVPDYPVDADRQRLSGKVRLQLKLEADGRVSDIDLVSATPSGMFDESAIRAFRDARFAPAQKNGRPVRALVLIEVVYDWEGRRR